MLRLMIYPSTARCYQGSYLPALSTDPAHARDGPGHNWRVVSAQESSSAGPGLLEARLTASQIDLLRPHGAEHATVRGQVLDPLAAVPGDLAELRPACTVGGGRAVHDPGGLLAPSRARY